MEKYKIKPRDAIHVATALENKIADIVGYDRNFDEVEGIKRIEP
jgi:predicted nucleic acid-binding protein